MLSNDIPTAVLPDAKLVPDVRAVLSAGRVGTFQAASGKFGPHDPEPIDLYVWNAQISSAFLFVFHICEITIRNAVGDALEMQYGSTWPWSNGFQRSLPRPSRGYSPYKDIHNLAVNPRYTTPGKIIPELKLAFWQELFESRYNQRLWTPYLRIVFPNIDPTKTISAARQDIFNALKNMRTFRNRVAHHEPIFARDLENELLTIWQLITYRCTTTADWMMQHQGVTDLLNHRP